MLRRFESTARLLGGSVFLVSVCVLLPAFVFHSVITALSGSPGSVL